MNFLSSGKIIWILAELCVLYFIAITSRIITAQQIQYNEIKEATCTVMDKINNTPVVLVSFRKLKMNCKFWEKYSIELYIFEIQLKRSLKKKASKNIF